MSDISVAESQVFHGLQGFISKDFKASVYPFPFRFLVLRVPVPSSTLQEPHTKALTSWCPGFPKEDNKQHGGHCGVDQQR